MPLQQRLVRFSSAPPHLLKWIYFDLRVGYPRVWWDPNIDYIFLEHVTCSWFKQPTF